MVVPCYVSEEALLKAAQDKHSRHFKQFDQHLDSYALLYPDQAIVQTLPGSSVPFTLYKYKEELGKPCTFVVLLVVQFLEEESDQSSEPGPSYISETITATSEAKERDGSSIASSCQVKTSPSTNGAVSKNSYPQEETALVQFALRHFPWTKLKHMQTLLLTSGLTLLESQKVKENKNSQGQKNYPLMSMPLMRLWQEITVKTHFDFMACPEGRGGECLVGVRGSVSF